MLSLVPGYQEPSVPDSDGRARHENTNIVRRQDKRYIIRCQPKTLLEAEALVYIEPVMKIKLTPIFRRNGS